MSYIKIDGLNMSWEKNMSWGKNSFWGPSLEDEVQEITPHKQALLAYHQATAQTGVCSPQSRLSHLTCMYTLGAFTEETYLQRTRVIEEEAAMEIVKDVVEDLNIEKNIEGSAEEEEMSKKTKDIKDNIKILQKTNVEEEVVIEEAKGEVTEEVVKTEETEETEQEEKAVEAEKAVEVRTELDMDMEWLENLKIEANLQENVEQETVTEESPSEVASLVSKVEQGAVTEENLNEEAEAVIEESLSEEVSLVSTKEEVGRENLKSEKLNKLRKLRLKRLYQ